MLLEINQELTETKFITPMAIDAIGENEKKLEGCISDLVGDVLFPELLVFGNERSFQKEPDIFAVNGKGDLVVFELKVSGQYDRTKTLQAMDYAQRYSHWRYAAINHHYKKCFGDENEFINSFEEHFGYPIDESDFNKKQKIIVISHSSSIDINNMANYWRERGIDIQEYFYRFYEIGEKIYFELSNELYTPIDNKGSCWINTNSKYGELCYLDMVKNQKVATYGSRGDLIGKWLNKATIFLYHNGYGIIAAGNGTSRIQETYYKEGSEYEDDERNMHLKNFISGVNLETGAIEKYIPANRIKELLERDFYFPNTIVSLSDDEAKILYEECNNVFTH
jgi:hypothetical protein